MDIDIDPKLLIFGVSRSRVKGQGQNSGQNCLSQPFLISASQLGAHSDSKESGWVLLAACQMFLAGCQNACNNVGAPMGWLAKVGKLPMLTATCQIGHFHKKDIKH